MWGEPERNCEAWAFLGLAGAAFTVAFSLPAGRILLALSLVLLVVDRVRRRRLPVMSAVSWLALLFVAVAVVVTVFGVNPAHGLPRLRKLLWFVAIPVSATLVTTPRRLSLVLGAYSAGTGVLALRTFACRPFAAAAAVRAGEFTSFVDALVDAGSMTDAQRLMIGVIVSLAFLPAVRAEGRKRLWWGGLLALQAVALIVNFKRGSWFCALAMVAVLVTLKARRRTVLGFAAIVLLIALLPPVRLRLVELKDEFRARRGGRLTMWTEVAPVLIRQHPWGVGYRSLTNDMMREINWRVEKKRDHLHSNILQVLVATGWLGLAVYLVWMGWAVADACRFSIAARAGPGLDATNALALLLMLLGLLTNGLVEYNFADGEIVMIYGLVMGCAAAGKLRSVPPSQKSTARPDAAG